MAIRIPRKKILAALETLEAGQDPLLRLDSARRLRETAEELEIAELQAARKAGATWTQIGQCYGLTKQGAQQRFRRGEQRTPPAK
ncbi:MAG: hypothetical protein ACT4PP_13470 [Sporichthyaceae bacterium]